MNSFRKRFSSGNIMEEIKAGEERGVFEEHRHMLTCNYLDR